MGFTPTEEEQRLAEFYKSKSYDNSPTFRAVLNFTVIEQFVKSTPNDQELGAKVRELIEKNNRNISRDSM